MKLPATSTTDPDYLAADATAKAVGLTNLTQTGNGDNGENNKVGVAITQSDPSVPIWDTITVTTSDTHSATLAKAVGVNRQRAFGPQRLA